MHEEPDEPSPLRVALNRYRAQFGEFPALFVVWRGPDEDLIELLDRAIQANKALSEEDMIRAQGGEPPTGDVLF
jgi:hypothetical protein